MRVAVVGAGPKGLYAVESLLRRVPTGLAVVVFDPRAPGEGAAYAFDQPAWLRLNVTSAIVEGFDGWRTARGEEPPLDPFPARALLGRYLAHRWARLRAEHPDTLHHVRREVRGVEPTASGWAVDGEEYDELLLATGHASDSPDLLAHGWQGPQPLAGHVYPVSGLSAVAPGSTVAVRGAGLTFIDVAVALTEGRGGRFTGPYDRPAYRPNGDEPGEIRPTARRGRFMAVKPQPGSRAATALPPAMRQAGLSAVLAARDAGRALDAVPQLARDLLRVVGGDPGDVSRIFAGDHAEADPVTALRRSLAVATDRERPNATWALGQAWLALYPAMVARFSLGGGLDFQSFTAVARRLGPLTWGPPPVNAAKILTLLDLGLVDASSLATDEIDTSGHRGPVRADVVVDAVLPGPGVVTGAATLPGRLVEAGLVGTCAGRRGVAHADDATALSPDGGRVEGLAVLGRPTEDATIGNDTLDHRVHPAIERWAARVASRVD